MTYRQKTRMLQCCCGLVAAVQMITAEVSLAQARRVATVGEDGKVVVQEVDASTPASGTPDASAKSSAQNNPSGQPGEKKPSDASGEAKKKGDSSEDSTIVKRPLRSEKESVAPIREEISLTEEGQVTFDVKGQPWEQVLQWLADSSRLSLDWQELPGDTLNLTTTRSYSLEEARDIINRHLLARGYSMVLNGELLSVLKISDIKSSLVPRVEPEELAQQMDHTLCKVSFDLNWLVADEAIEELAPLLSKAGRISKLSRTNRLEIMDTASSLKDIHRILMDEQSDTGQEQLVKTFRLKHRRASEVIELLRTLLGLENEGGGGGSRSSGGGMADMGRITSMMQQMQQQMQRMGNSGGSKGGGGGKEPTKTRLVLNQRENMILAQAAPDQMAIISKAIDQIDVPVEASNSLLQNVNKMKIYRLETVDPQVLVDLLQELGDMAPGTVLKVDSDKNSIVAFASLADHLTITTLVERLDQSARQVEVIPLRRLDAEYVVGTIRALMAPPPREESNSRYSYYSRYSQPEQKKEEKEFKVEADIENNRILVYANKVEMDEIMLLLQKLGEIPDPNAADNGIRVFELSPEEDPQELMERIKRLWRRGNELQMNIPESKDSDAEEAASADDKTVTATEKSSGPKVDVWPGNRDATVSPAPSSEQQHLTAGEFFNLAARGNLTASEQNFAPEIDEPTVDTENAADRRNLDESEFVADPAARRLLAVADDPGAPVQFSTTPDGQLIVSSEDPAALQELEDLMKQIARPAPKYRVFYLKYATPSWVTLNLEDYFEAEEESDSSYRYDPWYGFMPSNRRASTASTLGQKRQPQFIYDNFTSSILVRNADRRQLQTIEELIRIYDVPEPADTRSMRVTKIFKLQNARAESVATAVKDVFRDLLSSNDKALEKKDGEKTQTRVYSYFGDDESDDGDTPIRFKGLLSIGVDAGSDTLVVSSTASLMETLGELIIELDKAAEQASSVQVLKLDPTVDISLIQERLSKALGTDKPQPNLPPNGKNGRPPANGVPIGNQPGGNGG